MAQRVVFDTNVLLAGLRSRRGASFRLLSMIGETKFELAVSVPLVLEYEEVLTRERVALGLSESEVAAVVDYVCSVAHLQEIFYLWRPLLLDASDDMVLELAANAQCSVIVTFNSRHFAGAERFGLRVLRPGEFLVEIGGSDEHP